MFHRVNKKILIIYRSSILAFSAFLLRGTQTTNSEELGESSPSISIPKKDWKSIFLGANFGGRASFSRIFTTHLKVKLVMI